MTRLEVPTSWPLHVYPSLDSTSDEARRIVLSGVQAPPFVLRALRQTNGRGRGTNTWWSDEGSLLFTLAFEPKSLGITPRQEPRLALISALAVIDSLPALSLAIRWPNDVVAGRLKICGILPERIDLPARPPVICLGVGINVNTQVENAPPEIQSLATSARALGMTTTCEAVFDAFLLSFREHAIQLACDAPEQADRWNSLNALANLSVRIRQGDQIVEGVVQAIDIEGALLLATASGTCAIHGGQLIHDP